MMEDATPPCSGATAGATDPLYRAGGTIRGASGADHGAKIHQSLVELPDYWTLGRKDLHSEVVDASVRGWRGCCPRKKNAVQHAVDIRVYCGDATLVCERRDRPGCVGADTGQLDETKGIVGHATTVFANNEPCGSMKIRRAAIVAETFPFASHITRRSVGQRLQVGIPSQEPAVIPQDARYLRLLEHELGYENPVGVSGPTPWQSAALSSEPFQEASLEPQAAGSGVSRSHARRIYASTAWQECGERGSLQRTDVVPCGSAP